MKRKLVSICIPTYNGEKFIIEALDSAIHQSYLNLEIIISDDSSNDRTCELIKKYKTLTKIPIKLFNHQPSGIGANWNNCIKKSKGEYIKFLFQDDVLFPTCIEDMMVVMKKDIGIGLVASKREIIKPQNINQFQSEWIDSYSDLQRDWNFGKEGIVYLNKEFLKDTRVLKSRENKIGEPSAILFKKSIIKKVALFREDLIQDLDYEFYNRVLKNYRIALLKKKLVGFRLHTGQATYINKNNPYNDTRILDHILLKDYFWYLDKTEKRNLLLKFFPKFRRLIKLIW